jgi:MoaA/NifB/PqqE/SkfB family radical SAM enzyme
VAFEIGKIDDSRRWGDFSQVIAGIEAAERVGLKIKLNAVALKGVNEDEYDDLIRFAHGRGIDLTLIETIPIEMPRELLVQPNEPGRSDGRGLLTRARGVELIRRSTSPASIRPTRLDVINKSDVNAGHRSPARTRAISGCT